VTDETVDRYGDIVRAKGVRLDNYKKNPVIQFAHDYSTPPIGVSIKTWYDKQANALKSLALFFDDRVDSSGRSDLIFRFVKSNGMRACSIGFDPIEWSKPSDKEREELGLGQYGVEYTACDMLEFSPVPLPANPNSLSNDYRKSFSASLEKTLRSGQFTSKDVDVLRKYPLFEGTVLDAFIKELGTSVITVKDVPIDTEQIVEIKPYPNEHACRLAQPDKFSEFRRGSRKHEGKTYSVIYGKVKDTDTWEEQAYRYPKDNWTESEARQHCTDHKGISFEPASEKDAQKQDAPTVVVNFDMGETQKQLCEIACQIKTFNGILDDALKSFEAKTAEFISIAQKTLSAVELSKKSSTLYDDKRIKSLLKL
jgi:hypothetical protein